MAVDPFDYLFSLEQFGIKFGLDNMQSIVEALGRPHDAFRSVHIAGTNGKGSVSAMIESALRAAGLRTGRYTSPHLVNLTERFAIDGEAIDEQSLRDAVSDVMHAVERLLHRRDLEAHPTFFEVTTASAFVLFRQQHVDVAVCEVGLGGRLDATNVLSPMATAITSIAFDHTQYLGSTLEAIAAEKAGTIKPRVPVIVGDVTRSVHQVIAAVAREQGAPLIDAHRGVTCVPLPSTGDDLPRVDLRTPLREYPALEIGLRGRHQIDNAIVAVRLLESLHIDGHPVDEAAIRAGLRNVVWPGRLQRIARPGGRSLLLDAAHNPDGARTLADYLRPLGGRPLVFAAMRDKDAAGILSALRGTVTAIVLTRASHPRSAAPDSLLPVVESTLGAIPVVVCESPADAVERAWTLGPDVVVAGSIFLLGDVMKGQSAS